ncbi:hypothetical protein LCGC14_2935960, partial [marine sediment metagenome]
GYSRKQEIVRAKFIMDSPIILESKQEVESIVTSTSGLMNEESLDPLAAILASVGTTISEPKIVKAKSQKKLITKVSPEDYYSRFRVFRSVSQYGESYINLSLMITKQYTYALHRNYSEMIKKLSLIADNGVFKTIVPTSPIPLETLYQMLEFIDKILNEAISMIEVTNIKTLVNSLNTDQFAHLFRILFVPPDLDISHNYETLETYGDAVLDKYLYQLLIQISNKFTSSTMHEHSKAVRSELKKITKASNMLHQAKRAIVSKYPLGEVFKQLNLWKHIPEGVTNPDISYQEDTVEALFGLLTIVLNSTVGSNYTDTYLLSLLREIIPAKLIHMVSYIPGNIRNIVVKGMLSDHEPSTNKLGNIVSIYVQFNDLKKLVD